MMHKSPKRTSFFALNEFTVLGVFVVAGLGMLFFGGIFGWINGDWKQASTQPFVPAVIAQPAPTTEEYQKETREVMTPFLEQAANMRKEDFADGTVSASMLTLADKTQERMIRIRVPKDSRDPHLSFVLLLDQWKRALGGSKPDQTAVLEKTPVLVGENPWVTQN